MSGVLFVDDELDNVELIAEILGESLDMPVIVEETVEAAVARLHEQELTAVVMDLFIPLGDHPDRVLGPRARRYQDQVDHLGGLVLLEEIERLERRPIVMSHTACTDHVLLEIFGDRVARRIPKPAPLDMLLRNVIEVIHGAS
jgi:CheY-like chemotaxis protein